MIAPLWKTGHLLFPGKDLHYPSLVTTAKSLSGWSDSKNLTDRVQSGTILPEQISIFHDMLPNH